MRTMFIIIATLLIHSSAFAFTYLVDEVDPVDAIAKNTLTPWPEGVEYYEVPVVLKIAVDTNGNPTAGSTGITIAEAINGDLVKQLNTVFAVQNGMPIRFYMDKSVSGDGVVIIKKQFLGDGDFSNYARTIRPSKAMVCVSSNLGGGYRGNAMNGAIWFDSFRGTGAFVGTAGTTLSHEFGHSLMESRDWVGYTDYEPPTGTPGQYDGYSDTVWCGFMPCDLHSFGTCSPYDTGGVDPCQWWSDPTVPCLDYTSCLANFPLAFRNYLTTNNYDIADYGDFGICNIMSYSSIGWMFTPQQKWGVMMTLEITNDRWSGFTRPPNKQYYEDLTGASLTLSDGVLSWSRVTSDRRGAIGFPDRYVVYQGAGVNGPWTEYAWVTAESSTGVFPATLACSAGSGSYWKVTPRDLETDTFRYEATGDDVDWKTYVGFTTSSSFYTYGYKYHTLYE